MNTRSFHSLLRSLALAFGFVCGNPLFADSTDGSFILINHVGTEDKPVPALVLTNAESVARNAAKLNLPSLCRIIVIEPQVYAQVRAIFEKEKSDAPRIDRQKIADAFGVFEISMRVSDHSENWLFVIAGDYAAKLFARTADKIRDKKLNPSLVTELKYLQRRCVLEH